MIMKLSVITPSVSSSCPQSSAHHAETSADEAIVAANARLQLKHGKQLDADAASNERGTKLGLDVAALHSLDTGDARHGTATPEVGASIDVARAVPTTENTATSLFEALAARLGALRGTVAPAFSPPMPTLTLQTWPAELTCEEGWRDLLGRIELATPEGVQLGAIAADHPSFAAVLATLRDAPAAELRKRAIVAGVASQLDIRALFEPPPARAAAIDAYSCLKEHFNELKLDLDTYYAPVIGAAATAETPDDVPQLPDPLLHALEQSLATAAQSPQMKQLPADADIESLVWLVMTECTRTEEELMRDQMNEMRRQNGLKKAQREKLSMLKEGNARLEAQMSEEFHMLQASGEIAPSITFDQYKAWRKVAWGDGQLNEDGSFVGPKPSLTPRPPIPSWLKTGKAEEATGTGDASGNKYGLDSELQARLQAIYDALPAEGRPSFDAWLMKSFGLEVVSGSGKAAIDAIVRNHQKVCAKLEDPKSLEPAAPVRETKPTHTFEEARAAAFELALVRELCPPISPNARSAEIAELTRRYDECVGALSPEDARRFNDWKRDVLPEALYAYGQQLRHSIDVVRGRIAEQWEQDYDRDTQGVMIKDGHIWVHVYDNEGDSDDSSEWRTWERLLGQDQDVGNRETDLHRIDQQAADVFDKLIYYTNGGELSEQGLASCVSNLTDGNVPQLPDAAVPPPPPQVDVDELKAEIEAARACAGNARASYEEIARMKRNPDGSFYGSLSDEAQTTFDELAARGVLKKGKSPEEARREEDERRRAEKELAVFVAGGNRSSPSGAVRLNHTGSLAELGAAADSAKTQLDSMSDLSELESMRLQQMLERRAKALETLTNVMKKLSQTSDSITSNLK